MTEDGKPINLNGSGNNIKMNVATTVPFNEANPAIITIDKTGTKFNNVNEEGSIKVI